MAVVAVAGNDAVLAGFKRRLQADRHRFLANVEVTEPADQPEAIELAGLFLEPADQQHLLVEMQQLVIAGGVTRICLMRLLQAAQSEGFVAGGSLGRRLAARSGLGQFRIPWGVELR